MPSLIFTRDASHPEKVVILKDGAYLCDMDWSVALQAAAALIQVARLGEEYAKANNIIEANALLIRTGAPFGLSSDPKILDASYNDAQWDSKSRKRMPLRGIPSRRRAGTPTVSKQ